MLKFCDSRDAFNKRSIKVIKLYKYYNSFCENENKMNSSRQLKEGVKKKERTEKLHTNPEQNARITTETEIIAKALRKWEEAKFDKNIQQRSYHSAVIFGTNLFIFGGYEINRGIMNDFYSLDLENKDFFTWNSISKNATATTYPGKFYLKNCYNLLKLIPKDALHRHTAVVFENKMYLYGGKVSIFENSNKLYSYEFEKNQWAVLNEEVGQKIDGLTFPLYIDSHNAEIYKTEMLVFGGFIGGSVALYSRCIFSYNFETKQWATYYLQSFKEKSMDKEPTVSTPNSDLPKKRANSGTSIFRDTLYIFGGTNGKKKLNDMWKYDLLGRKWAKIEPKELEIFPDVPPFSYFEYKTKPSFKKARSGHSMLVYQDKILLFGGIHDIAHEKNDILVFNCKEERWARIEENSTKRPDNLSNSSHNLRKKTTIHDNSQIFGDSKPKFFGLNVKEARMTQNKNFFHSNVYSKSSKILKPTAHPRKSILFNATVSSLAPKSPNQLKEERVRKERNMRKIMLLSEFEVTEDVRRKLVIHSPTTEAMRNSINTIKIEVKTDLKKIVEKIKTMDPHATAMMMINNAANPNERRVNLIKGKKPCARDGCTATLYKEKVVIFGGDRHLMTFHDMFFLNLKLGFEEIE